MTQTYEHPVTKARETVSDHSGAWVLVFGLFYMIYKGLWVHSLILLGISFLCVFVPPLGLTFLFFASIFYVFEAPEIISRKYISEGWLLLEEKAAAASFFDRFGANAAGRRDSPCPFCDVPINPMVTTCPNCLEDTRSFASGNFATSSAGNASRGVSVHNLKAGDMCCVNCLKHIPKNASTCAYCGLDYPVSDSHVE